MTKGRSDRGAAIAVTRANPDREPVREAEGRTGVTSRLAAGEQQALRKAQLRKSQLSEIPPKLVAELTKIPLRRCEQLFALLTFEAMESVGSATAEDLWALGYHSVESLRNARPRQMYDRLCRISGTRLDPCVEDVFCAVVAQARDPNLPSEQRNWWYWTALRKARDRK